MREWARHANDSPLYVHLADVIAGRVPQLERAIAVVMEELKKNPPVAPKRPPYKKTGPTPSRTTTSAGGR